MSILFMKSICVLLLGGTISKVSNDHFDNGYFPAMLSQARLSPSLLLDVVDVFARDSTTLSDPEITYVSNIIKEKAKYSSGIVLIMGTDGMIKVSKMLKDIVGDVNIPIAITGSIIPWRSGFSDAIFNFGQALAHVGSSSEGFYICMNGIKIQPECAEKDLEKQMFVDVCKILIK